MFCGISVGWSRRAVLFSIVAFGEVVAGVAGAWAVGEVGAGAGAGAGAGVTGAGVAGAAAAWAWPVRSVRLMTVPSRSTHRSYWCPSALVNLAPNWLRSPLWPGIL